MNISNNNISDAKKFLLESLNYNTDDPQIMFNLSGAYLHTKEYQKSYEYILKCLKISPNYRNADILKAEIENYLRQ